MDELDHNLLMAWNRVFERCRADPREARRRLERVGAGTCLDRPHRAWCVAVRASDTRISSAYAGGFAPSPSQAEGWDEGGASCGPRLGRGVHDDDFAGPSPRPSPWEGEEEAGVRAVLEGEAFDVYELDGVE